MALYIIFLGIVPMIALSMFGVWYVRNPGQHWKKGMMSTYVSSFDRVKEKRKRQPHGFSSSRDGPSTHTIGKNFYERVVILFSPRQSDSSRNTDRVFTISDNLPPKEKLQITKTKLISTTNPDAINCSNSIVYRKSMLLASIEASQNPSGNRMSDDYESDRSATVAAPSSSSIESRPRKNSLRAELGAKISERIQQMQKKPSKNVKGLTLKTEVKFEHLNESPSGISGITPSTGEPLISADESHLKTPAPFYNKKPPPPPAPAQSLKPKI